MNPQTSPSSGASWHSTVHDIFVMGDEQILEIDPEAEDVEISTGSRPALDRNSVAPAGPQPQRASLPASAPDDRGDTSRQDAGTTGTSDSPGVAEQTGPATAATTGTSTTAAPFSTPDDVRALAELYPGGLTQAKTAAERARLLDEIDRAYFGAPASTPDQARASRAQLAAMMLREDPAAFREMVYEGLRALDAAGYANVQPSVAAVFRPRGLDAHAGQTASQNLAPANLSAARPAQEKTPPSEEGGHSSAPGAHVAAYSAFEKAANADLEKSVGGAIDRALHQALPNIAAADRSSASGVPDRGAGTSLQARLSQAIREDVEHALQSDHQLGEQVAQILSSRRLDDATRAQVVRLINDRALQLVPGAAKRALNEWTQATLAAHRSKTTRSEAATSRREVAPAAAAREPHPANPNTAQQSAANRAARSDSQPASRTRVNYGKLSDEQILNM